MLNTIKEIIKDKSNFLEAAAIIFEDGSGQNLDDVIVLGEEKETDTGIDGDLQENDHHEEPSDDDDEKEEKEEKEPKDSDDHEGEGSEGDNNSPEDDDVGNLTIDDEPAEDTSPVEDPMGGNDILDSDIGDPDQPMPLPGSDLPTPMGAQTGEPINPMDDILNVEIDLGSNTVKDVLPVPPANANEALTDGDATQHVDSGFGEESNVPTTTPSMEEFGEKSEIKEDKKDIPEEKPVEESENYIESFFSNSMTEAITFGDEPAAPAEGEAAPAAPATTEEPAPAATDIPAEGDESGVTSAVRDKVAEAEAETVSEDGKDAKEELLKKLGSITKNLEDAKKAVMSAIQ